jgi:hypothetical protein
LGKTFGILIDVKKKETTQKNDACAAEEITH